MTRKMMMLFLGSGLLWLARPLPGATNTERMDFPPGGTIRIDGSVGYLLVEGWDQPEVEVTVTKSRPHFNGSTTKTKPDDRRRIESLHVTTNRVSSSELTISTDLASRHGDWIPFLPRTTTSGVDVEFEIHVPRDSRLVIHHRSGYVFVNGVTGDVEASASRGDIVLMVPDSGAYSIDAKTKLGAVASDFEGSAVSRYIVGQRFERTPPASMQHLYLRMGFGGITIKAVPREGEVPVLARTK